MGWVEPINTCQSASPGGQSVTRAAPTPPPGRDEQLHVLLGQRPPPHHHPHVSGFPQRLEILENKNGHGKSHRTLTIGKRSWNLVLVMEFQQSILTPEFYQICAFSVDIAKFSIGLGSLHVPTFSARFCECERRSLKIQKRSWRSYGNHICKVYKNPGRPSLYCMVFFTLYHQIKYILKGRGRPPKPRPTERVVCPLLIFRILTPFTKSIQNIFSLEI